MRGVPGNGGGKTGVGGCQGLWGGQMGGGRIGWGEIAGVAQAGSCQLYPQPHGNHPCVHAS